MKFNSYPKTKPSGVEWFGDVPEHWTPISLSRSSTQYAGGTPDRSNDSYWDDGTIPWINSGAVNQGLVTEPSAYITEEAYRNSSARWVPKGALVMALAGQGKTKGMVAQTGIATTCNQSMAAICPSPPMEARYLYWLLASQYEHIRNMAGGEARDGLNLEILGGIPCLKIPPTEQLAIASFLDRETGRMDALVAKKRELIERLKEKRTALISRTVTRGLPPAAARAAGLPENPPLKPSGLDWLGDIPAHWEVKKLSWLFRYAKGPSAAMLTKEYVADNGGDYPVFSGQTENEGLMGMIDWHEFDFPSPVIFVTTVGARAMSTRLVRGKFSLSQNCALIIPRSGAINPAFYEAVLRRLFDYERRSISLIMQPSLRFDDLDKFRVPLPPPEEQTAIAAYLDEETAKLDALVAKVETAIERLQEYRTALITAAVTGKIDAREEVQG